MKHPKNTLNKYALSKKVNNLDINLIANVKKSEEKIFRRGYYTGLSAILGGGVPSVIKYPYKICRFTQYNNA